MGIKGLHKFIRDKFPGVLKEVHLSEFSYEIVAIDISLYAYKFKAINPTGWLYSFINLIGCLRRNHIHCIFVYDSKAPKEKDDERKRRREEMEKRAAKISELEDALVSYTDTGIRLPCLVEFIDKNVPTGKKLLSDAINVDAIEFALKKMRTQVISFTEYDLRKTKELFDILHVPYVDAPEEAEAMASKLCRVGKVKAVLSEDSDVIAYRAPILLSKIDTRRDTCIQIKYTDLLEEMNWSEKQFLDFCIMCGTDYNKNIPKIGPISSYKLIDKYKKIEEIEKECECDVSILNHNRVRQLFRKPRSYKIPLRYCGKPNIEKLREFYSENGIVFYLEKIQEEFFGDNTVIVE